MTPPDYTKIEAKTREEIDQKLIAAGWAVQDKNRLNLYKRLGVAVREMDTDTGPADYMLFINGKTPRDGRKFTQHNNVNVLDRTEVPDATKVVISTIKRIYSQLTEFFGDKN